MKKLFYLAAVALLISGIEAYAGLDVFKNACQKTKTAFRETWNKSDKAGKLSLGMVGAGVAGICISPFCRGRFARLRPLIWQRSATVAIVGMVYSFFSKSNSEKESD